jgi:hypothetical protein
MYLGTLKNLLLENNIKKIVVHSDLYPNPLEVIDAIFDQKTRNIVFLNVGVKNKPRTNNYNLLKSYLLDFKDTHKVLIKNTNRSDAVYHLEPSFNFDRSDNILNLYAANIYSNIK